LTPGRESWISTRPPKGAAPIVDGALRITYPLTEALMRDMVRLFCSTCQRNNYYTDKNKRTTTEKLEFKKYCSWCRKAQVHKEGKMPNPKKN
jgi:large subunit ribosomal protein L33